MGEISLGGVFAVQRSDALLWIIDTAPLFLGLFAYFAGVKQDGVRAVNDSLEQRVKEQTQDLLNSNQSMRFEIETRIAREGELVEAYEAAEAATRAKDSFISNVSHEIRTPLNGIIGLTDVLLRTELTVAQRESMQAVEYSGRNLLVIINDVLDLAKASANKLELDPKDFVLVDVLKSVEYALKGKAKEKGIGLKIDLAESLPEMLRGDAVRLGQILINLAGNAVKFTEKGGVTVVVSALSLAEDKVRVGFKIEDTGIGIAKENHPKLFGDFAQAHAGIATKYGGTGLGLSISRKLIELHGGELTFESVEDQGTVFSFAIDFDRAKSNDTVEVGNKYMADLTADQKASLRVLLVEDNKVNQMVAKGFLNRYGLRFDIAENGVEGVAAVSRGNYDLVLMDVHMPEMDGLEASRQIRRLDDPVHQKIKIIAMTASVLNSEVNECYTAGMDDYTAKPFNAQELYGKIVALIGAVETTAR